MTRLSLIVTCLLLAVAFAATGGSCATLPSIYVDYGDDCVFAMHADGGIGLAATTAPGSTIPPGIYQVVLRVPQDAPSCPLQFQLLGPGVQLRWDFGGEAIPAEETATFQPSATYVATDLRNPSRFRAVFSTSASGSSSSLVTQTPSTANGADSSSRDFVGSRLLPYRGSVTLTLAAAGVPRLAAHGKTVRSLKAGRYDVALVDASSRAGLAVRRPNGTVTPLTASQFTGKKTAKLALRSGMWRFTAGAATLTVTVTG